MVESSTLVTLPQLVDLSLNCHEGLINFHTLHSLLHIIIVQSGINDVNVEFRGSDSEKVQAIITGAKTSNSETPYQEYSIKTVKGTGGGGQGVGKKRPSKQKAVSLQDIKEIAKVEEKRERELRVIERRKDSKEEPALNPLPLKSPPGSLLGIRGESTVVVVESDSKLPQFSIAVSKATFDEMQEEITTLKEKMQELTELPGNMGLIEATKTASSPILDMFQILNLTKRVDATEIALHKFSSLVEEVVKNGGAGTAIESYEKIKEFQESIKPSSEGRGSIGGSRGSGGGKTSGGGKASGGEDVKELQVRVERLEKLMNDVRRRLESADFETISQRPSTTPSAAAAPPAFAETHETFKAIDEPSSSIYSEASKPSDAEHAMRIKYNSIVQGMNLVDLQLDEAIDMIQQEFASIARWINAHTAEGEKVREVKGDSTTFNVGGGNLESRFVECSKHIQAMDKAYSEQIRLVTEQLDQVQKEINEIASKTDALYNHPANTHSVPGTDASGVNAETTMELANKLGFLEKEIVTIGETAEKLQAEKIERDKNIETILEQIDVLKIVKANREDLEDALGDKADACQINRKVSHDQFDAACDDLSRGIEEALNKLSDQEEMWNQALEAIQKEVGNKLDRMEVDPLRDFVTNKLKALQEKFKSLTALKREHEAAGTKSKVLRDVNCISCDRDVIMRKEMDPTLKPRPHALPPNRSMAPYLAYELDQLRKQQKCVPGSKNLNFFETAMKTRSTKKDHVCNRYCGGSHTVTTPQQRVTRLGHFLEQWGPEIAPLNDEYIRGNDNQMYKASNGVKKSVQGGENASLTVKESIKSGKEESVSKDEVPQQDRKIHVSTTAQEILSEEADDSKAKDGPGKKYHSIGAVGRYAEEGEPHPEISEDIILQQRGSLVKSQSLDATPKVIQGSGEIYAQTHEKATRYEPKKSASVEKRSSSNLKTVDSKQNETKKIGFQ